MYKLTFVLIAFLTLITYSCTNPEKPIADAKTDSAPPLHDSSILVKRLASLFPGYTIELYWITESQFKKHSGPRDTSREHFFEITDVDEAMKIMDGRIEFDTETPYIIRRIQFKNGKKIETDFLQFSSYFPDEGILLTEGGHTSDVSFNMRTGDTTESTGNPNFICTSPGKTYRINGYFGGQECYSYFLQLNESGSYTKMFDLDQLIEVCNLEEYYWETNGELNFKTYIDTDNNRHFDFVYYKLRLIKR